MLTFNRELNTLVSFPTVLSGYIPIRAEFFNQWGATCSWDHEIMSGLRCKIHHFHQVGRKKHSTSTVFTRSLVLFPLLEQVQLSRWMQLYSDIILSFLGGWLRSPSFNAHQWHHIATQYHSHPQFWNYLSTLMWQKNLWCNVTTLQLLSWMTQRSPRCLCEHVYSTRVVKVRFEFLSQNERSARLTH